MASTVPAFTLHHLNMAASACLRTMNLFPKTLHFLSYRQISLFNSEVIPIHRSYVHLRKPYMKYSSTSTAPNDQPAADKANNGEGEQLKSEASPREKELLLEKEKLLEDVKNLNDKYKRALADNENIRTRMRREINDAKQYGIQGFVKDLVEVADVLGKATESVPKEALNSGSSHLKSLFEGLQMTEAQLLSVFKRHGVAQVNPIGEKFNPNLHEALFEQVDESKEPGTVGTVTKVGYKLHDRVVRPAMVGVVKAK
ncbi:grpE protein homolog 1, mitochondrial [Trichonephila clavata]|uniref:GrpE protein homolog n=1 Tax=Trichonephila clavata TaxID=2740835 RepID=A0A8X6JF33_TRICU|nr:grpE protein homolog 1, mitochondrial [Trichonephila clavata]